MIIKNLLLEVITFFNILRLVKSNIEYKINENITENNDIKNSYNFNQDFSEFNNSLKSILERDIILENELMKKHTTFRIGGPAKYFVKPKTVNQIIEIIKLCNKYKVSYFILGNGSNLLVSDSGYNGVVIQINESNFSNLKVRKKTKENYILKVEGGMSMRSLSIEAGLLSLKGLEDIIDIPGTVGGGIVMNATFRGNGLLNSLESVKVITSEGTLMRLTKKECGLTTRSSVLKDKKYLVIEATFKLEKGNQMEIQKTMTHNTELRYQKQPMYYGSAGSFFVWNHTKHGSMYEKYKKNNLVSYRVGDAMIYTNNISFIINLRNASAADVINVVRHIEKVIKDNYNIDMRREVVVLGTFN